MNSYHMVLHRPVETASDYGQTAPYRLSSGPDRISSLNFAKVKKSAVRKSMPCSAKAFASAVIAAFVAATAAKAGFGSRAALPDIKTTEPLVCFRASHARI